MWQSRKSSEAKQRWIKRVFSYLFVKLGWTRIKDPLLLMKTLLSLATFILFMTTAPAAEAPYRHVVLFKFKDSATPEQVQGVEKAFIELAKKVETIKGFEWGNNVSPEGKNDGFTHCFLVTFADKAGLDVYLPHPAHAEFVSLLKPTLDKVCVFDYVAK